MSFFEGTFEITTNIMKRGCAVACKICPQPLLSSSYSDDIRFLSFRDFVKVLHKIPKTYRIDFSGYAEPFLNRDCVKMIKYTSDNGYYFCCYTTLVGVSLENIETLSKLRFSREKNCPLEIHLPDKEGVMPITITDTYKKVVKNLWDRSLPFVNWMTMNKNGILHPEIRQLLNTDLGRFSPVTRANNLSDGNKMTEGQVKNADRINGPISCGTMPRLNHNVMLPNGDVQLCCMDYGLQHKLGNIIKDSHEDLFTGSEFARLKRLMKEDSLDPKDNILCRNCEIATYV
tara:strand:- start:811 stop:1671 length:861 start_codon:yes stop_codon:yes gene_type:complete